MNSFEQRGRSRDIHKSQQITNKDEKISKIDADEHGSYSVSLIKSKMELDSEVLLSQSQKIVEKDSAISSVRDPFPDENEEEEIDDFNQNPPLPLSKITMKRNDF